VAFFDLLIQATLQRAAAGDLGQGLGQIDDANTLPMAGNLRLDAGVQVFTQSFWHDSVFLLALFIFKNSLYLQLNYKYRAKILVLLARFVNLCAK
jgi:hypothetical protein